MDELNIAYIYFSVKLNQISLAYNDTAYKFDLIDISINYSGLKSGETIISMVAPTSAKLAKILFVVLALQTHSFGTP